MMRLIVFVKLQEIKELAGKRFIKAWLKIVKCEFHLICPWFIKLLNLAKSCLPFVKHDDPSLWNIMYDPASSFAVFSNYNLAILSRQACLLLIWQSVNRNDCVHGGQTPVE